jgi:hypothetical protein
MGRIDGRQWGDLVAAYGENSMAAVSCPFRPRGGVRIEACDGPAMAETHRRPATVTRVCFIACPALTSDEPATAFA